MIFPIIGNDDLMLCMKYEPGGPDGGAAIKSSTLLTLQPLLTCKSKAIK